MRLNRLAALAALSATLAIAAGAFGAHGAADARAAEWLRTGAAYQLAHAIAALVLLRRCPASAVVMLAGAMLFAGTLYAMSLGAPHWLGAVTPIGGTLLIIGWFWTAWLYWRG